MLENARLVAFVATVHAARARAFYVDVLGLHLVSDDAFALVLDAGGTTLRIAKVDELRPQPFTVLGWSVADIDATVAALRRAGVEPERYPFVPPEAAGVWTAPGGARVAWFKDPDGNTLSVTQP